MILKGIYRPTVFFENIKSKKKQDALSLLINRIIFTFSFFLLGVYFLIELIQQTAFNNTDLESSKFLSHTLVWCFSLFVVKGTLVAIFCHFMSLRHEKIATILSVFYAQIFSIISSILISCCIVMLAFFVTIKDSLLFLFLSLPYIVFQLYYTYIAIRVNVSSAQTEAIFLLFISFIISLLIDINLNLLITNL